MKKWWTLTNYSAAATDYEQMRIPGKQTVRALKAVFASVADDGQILSLGCGTGQYEAAVFDGKNVTCLDKSEEMLRIARTRVRQCVQGDMLDLHFEDRSFDGVYFVQSLHHVGANLDIDTNERTAVRKTALGEAERVLRAGPLAIVQRDPSQNAAIWFWKYFPKALQTKLIIQPTIELLVKWLRELGLSSISANPVDDPMISGFYDEEAPLDPRFQRAFSEFSYLSANELADGCANLRAAIARGEVTSEIEQCKRAFASIGGTVFVVSAIKQA